MDALKLFESLCTPAQLYLGISALSVLAMCYQNIGNPNVIACVLMKADTPVNNAVYLVLEILYVLVWTYLLNILCKKGYNKLLQNERQIIFYGPPGTGKTYTAKEFVNCRPSKWVMVVFHPSYSYEDFVEGFRPVVPDDKE